MHTSTTTQLVIAFVALSFSCFLLSSASSSSEVRAIEADNNTNSTSGEPLRIGLMMINRPANLGWEYNHDRARTAMEAKYGKNQVVYIIRPNVGYGEFLTRVEELVGLGCKVIMFGTDYSDLRRQVVKKYPQMYFVSFGAFESDINQADVAVNSHEAFFLSGIIAGLMTKTNKIGFLTAFYYAGGATANSIFYGGRLVNPNLELVSTELHNWSEITRAEKGVQIMASQHNVDFVASLMSNSQVQSAASRLGISTFGYPGELTRVIYGEVVLTSCVLNWEKVYDEVIQMMRNNTWKKYLTLDYGMADGVVNLASYSSEVPYEVISKLQPWITAVKKRVICPQDVEGFAERIRTVFPDDVKDKNGCVLLPLLGWKLDLDKQITDLGYLSDDTVFDAIYVHFDEQIALIVIVCAVDLLIILSGLVIFYFRSTILIVTTNVYFCFSFLLGALFGYSDIFFWLGRPTDAICHARIWFLAISFTLIFGALMAKALQVWKMWTNPDLKDTRNTKWLIVGLLGFLWVSQITLLAVISGLNGYHSSNIFTSELAYDQYYVNCSLSSEGLTVGALLLGFDGVIMIIVAALAYMSRNVSKKFRESNSIVLSVYSILVSLTIVILLFVNLKSDNPSTQLKIIACGIFIYITLPLVSVFGPKLKVLFMTGSRSATSNNTNSNSHSFNSHT